MHPNCLYVRAMYSVALIGPRVLKGFSSLCTVSRKFCSKIFNGDDVENGLGSIEDYLNESWKSSEIELSLEENASTLYDSLDSEGNICSRKAHIDEVKSDAERVLEVLHEDGLGIDAKQILAGLSLRVSGLLVREVLIGILKTINHSNKNRCAKLGYKFFVWSGEQENYRHAVSAYHLMMDIFAESDEFKAMMRLLDEMIEKGYPTTARTFNILICTCCGAGLARKVVERFIKSKSFKYRPFKHSYNAILHSLLTLNQYKLIEWVHRQMLAEGHSPDVLTYNIIMCAKFRLGKLVHFHRLLDEMGRGGLSPDFHTFNLLLHVLGKGDKPLAALKLLNHMGETGIHPTVLHFTTLIDGLSRAGNMEASQYFFDRMIKCGCEPDVVSYTVMITGYVVSGQFDKAREMFDGMARKGKLPNVFTYNSMIRGLCMDRKYEDACSMLKEMESKGCNPNFLVYTTLVGNLRSAGKLSEAHEVIRQMVEKGQYTHLLSKIRRFRR